MNSSPIFRQRAAISVIHFPPVNQGTYEQEIAENFRHNFIFNMLDGASFWLGYSFIAASVILPLYVSHFTSSTILIGLIPTIGSIGYLLPQLFTSRWVARMPRKKFMPVNVGFFTERLPILLLPFSALFFATDYPALALAAFFILYSWHGFGAGLVAVAWQDMIAKIIPVSRRGRFFGLTNFLGAGTGVLGAAGAAWVLNIFDFPTGFVLAFTAAAFFILLSWIFLAQTREPAWVAEQTPLSAGEYARQLPALVRGDVNFRNFLITGVVNTLSGMGSGFLIVYASRRWSLPDGEASLFTTAMLIGQALSNLAYGAMSDRWGHKLVLQTCAVLAVLSYALAVLAPAPLWFYLVFALRGAINAGGYISGISITMEFSPQEQRPMYIGLANTIFGIAAALAPLIGGALVAWIDFSGLFILSTLVSLAAFGMYRWWVREPRFAEK